MTIKMTYEVIILGHLHMPLYFIGTFTEYPLIKGDSLILSIPENLSLEGAIMEILCSENARISPDPGEVEDWGKLQNFTVTAYNNTQRVYKGAASRQHMGL